MDFLKFKFLNMTHWSHYYLSLTLCLFIRITSTTKGNGLCFHLLGSSTLHLCGQPLPLPYFLFLSLLPTTSPLTPQAICCCLGWVTSSGISCLQRTLLKVFLTSGQHNNSNTNIHKNQLSMTVHVLHSSEYFTHSLM